MEEKKRTCIIQRGSNGFGFILCCENETTDTYVLHVLAASPAGTAGLKPGDRIIEVNGINVEKEEHKNVVERLQGMPSIRLVVTHNDAAEEYFKKPSNGMTVKPLEAGPPVPRPKLITVRKNEKGFDFALQTVGKTKRSGHERHRPQLKGVTGHYASSVRADGVAYRAGLREGHRIIEINGVDIGQECHAYVISVIKSSDPVKLLIVDKETDEFFRRHGVSPSAKHLTGELEFKISSPVRTTNNKYHHDTMTSNRIDRHQTMYKPSPLLPTATSTPNGRSPSSPLHGARSPVLAMSTPNLTAIGLGRSKSMYSADSSGDFETIDKANRKERTAKAKKEIKKRLSRREKKSAKSLYNKMDLPGSRRLYDDTVISDDVDTASISSSCTAMSTSSYIDHKFEDLSLHDGYVHGNGYTPPRISRSVSDVGKSKMMSPFYKPKLPSTDEKTLMTYEQSECDSPPPGYESPEELSTVGFNVDLKTLKERVRKTSSRSRNEIVRSKSKLSDYSLAHMYVNSY